MSDWIGPNVYRIESHKDRKTAVTVKDGNKDDGAAVVLKASDANKNDHWQFVHVGTGVSGKEEFLIINCNTGYHLTYAEEAKQAPLTVTRNSPTHYRCRWNIAPTRNGTGAFWIVAAKDNKMMLVTEGEKTIDNVNLQIWKGTVGSLGTWWYLKLVDGQTLQSADLGKAPAP
ncbi:hypothetical protein COCMIDRAFT_10404 [Bipolaris oryzae ATCC 44560]|uniref:Ricin B lectin domain-containing protein n=1 Tax=Bipolaris oryzae ATCC 44560 TaxID=930090 RepID=W6YPQ8_COCMI|nr:uncharacterized protein COCMIDRAFT_10404 [Bipolaris oryzae ATCC 44560]EUC39503.1 hypothetical protein COCMIDRAFT_10404 [Bipolaris oryzae ATCC 44560]